MHAIHQVQAGVGESAGESEMHVERLKRSKLD